MVTGQRMVRKPASSHEFNLYGQPGGVGSGRKEGSDLLHDSQPLGILDRLGREPGYSRLDLEERSRRVVAFFVVLITTPVLFGAFVYYLSHGLYFTAFSILPVAMSFSFVPLQLRFVENAGNVYRINLVLAALLLLRLFYIAAPHGHAALWLYLFPMGCFFQLGKQEGLLFSLLLIVFLSLVFVFYDLYLGSIQYSRPFIARFFLVYLMLCGCSYSYESVRSAFRKKMIQKQWELQEEKEKLAESKRVVEAASAAKTEFLSNMSHELRTPLNHIIGFSQLLADEKIGKVNNEQREYLNYVLQSGNHLLALISDILDLTKVEAGKLRLQPSEVNLRALLENSLLMVREQALKHEILLTKDVNGVPETFTADEAKLKRIFYNLLSNSIKFTPKGGTINVAVRHVSEASESKEERKRGSRLPPFLDPWVEEHVDYMEISVSDDGIGIKEDHLEKIFEPFEQVENSTSRKYGGTGLGLPLTRKLVELHGGKIWAESDGEGKGSRFRFVLPVSSRREAGND